MLFKSLTHLAGPIQDSKPDFKLVKPEITEIDSSGDEAPTKPEVSEAELWTDSQLPDDYDGGHDFFTSGHSPKEEPRIEVREGQPLQDEGTAEAALLKAKTMVLGQEEGEIPQESLENPKAKKVECKCPLEHVRQQVIEAMETRLETREPPVFAEQGKMAGKTRGRKKGKGNMAEDDNDEEEEEEEKPKPRAKAKAKKQPKKDPKNKKVQKKRQAETPYPVTSWDPEEWAEWLKWPEWDGHEATANLYDDLGSEKWEDYDYGRWEGKDDSWWSKWEDDEWEHGNVKTSRPRRAQKVKKSEPSSAGSKAERSKKRKTTKKEDGGADAAAKGPEDPDAIMIEKPKDGVVPPPHVTYNMVYSSAYRKASHLGKEMARQIGQEAGLIFRTYGVVDERCGQFRTPKVSTKKGKNDKDDANKSAEGDS